ncbi:MAG: polysaccharide ABC transporter ATP-binding protein [Gelidibacter sp.]
MEPIIKIENLGKQYRLGSVGTGTLAHDITRWWYNVRGKADPYLKIGETNDRTTVGNSDYVWALQNVNFEVQPGEILGVIGRNGAGKSTLLKLLSRVTAPSTGKITCHGRIASLLEVGTGFHPELTGRENIYLNGAILGMSKKEISSKFDEIVEFAGCAKYIETPVKRYSSGMYVRLAFAVAAHLEPDILVVDEVLAVGDAEFQKKAIGKMQEVSQGQGRTVLFVSHNMDSIRSLCNKTAVLSAGTLDFIGDTDKAISHYLKNGKAETSHQQFDNYIKDELQLRSIEVQSKGITNEDIKINVHYTLFEELKNLRIILNLFNEEGIMILSTSDFYSHTEERKREVGSYLSSCVIPKNLMNSGSYFVSVSIDIPKVKAYFVDETLGFAIEELSQNQLGISLSGKPRGVIHPLLDWNVKRTNG